MRAGQSRDLASQSFHSCPGLPIDLGPRCVAGDQRGCPETSMGGSQSHEREGPPRRSVVMGEFRSSGSQAIWAWSPTHFAPCSAPVRHSWGLPRAALALDGIPEGCLILLDSVSPPVTRVILPDRTPPPGGWGAGRVAVPRSSSLLQRGRPRLGPAPPPYSLNPLGAAPPPPRWREGLPEAWQRGRGPRVSACGARSPSYTHPRLS